MATLSNVEIRQMKTVARLELLVSLNEDSCLITTFSRQTVGKITGWFAHGRQYRIKTSELLCYDWGGLVTLFEDKQLDYGDEISDREMMKPSQLKKYKIIMMELLDNGLKISPFGKADRYGGAIGKYFKVINHPIGNNELQDTLRKAIEDAG